MKKKFSAPGNSLLKKYHPDPEAIRLIPDPAFTVYFGLMFCLYTHTYIQLFIQLALLAYIGIPFLKKWVNKTLTFRQALLRLSWYLWWIGLFTFLLLVSRFWSYSVLEGSKTAITMFRIFAICGALWYYCDTEEKALQVLLAFVIGVLIMTIAAFATSSVSSWGSEYGFGEIIGQHRNQIGAVTAPLAFLCFAMYKQYGIRYCLLLSVFFAAAVCMTGSRSSIIQLFLLLFLGIWCSMHGVKQKLIALSVLCAAGFCAVYFIPFFHRVVWDRFINAFLTFIGINLSDTSVSGRTLYQRLAWMMFKERPILGFGVDGFTCYLRDHSRIMGPYLEATYAHCNYAELAADFGILGLLIWYVPVLAAFFQIIRNRKKKFWYTAVLCTFFTMLLSDYGRIPWATHLQMYFWCIIVLLCRYSRAEHSTGYVC